MRVRLTRTMGNRNVGDVVDVTQTEAEWLRDRGYITGASVTEGTGTEDTGTEDTGTEDTGTERGKARSRSKGKP